MQDVQNQSNEGGLSDGVDDINHRDQNESDDSREVVDDINEGDQNESEDSREVVDESDSSEDEVCYNDFQFEIC